EDDGGRAPHAGVHDVDRPADRRGRLPLVREVHVRRRVARRDGGRRRVELDPCLVALHRDAAAGHPANPLSPPRPPPSPPAPPPAPTGAPTAPTAPPLRLTDPRPAVLWSGTMPMLVAVFSRCGGMPVAVDTSMGSAMRGAVGNVM